MKKLPIAVALTSVVALSLSIRIAGQRGAQPAAGAAPPGDVVVGSGNYSPIVSDLDKAIEFYGNLLGLTVPPVQAPGPPEVLPVMRNSEPPFHYPPALYAQKVQANVTLHLHIDSLGTVTAESTFVVDSSGYPALDSAAIAGARALQFSPAQRDGRPVAVSVKFPILFRHPDAAPPTPGDSGR